MKPIIVAFLTHPNPHADEILGKAILRAEGWRKYKGLENAPMEFVANPRTVCAQTELKRGRLCIGVGHGIYDEHNTGSLKSCSQLVAEDLGLYGTDPALTKVVNWVRYADRTKNVSEFEWPTLIKGWHRLAPPEQVFQWGEEGLLDLYRYERGDKRYGEQTFSMSDLANSFQAMYGDAVHSHNGLRRIYNALLNANGKETQLPPMSFFNVVRVWQELYPVESHNVIRFRAERHLKRMADLAMRFQEVYDSFVPDFLDIPLQKQNGQNHKCAVLHTDNPDTAKVARIKGADIVIVQDSNGNIRILTNTVKNPLLDMSVVAEVIRKREMYVRGADRPLNLNDTDYWQSPETITEVPEWYFLKAGMLILNGSDQSSRDVPATHIPLETVFEIVRNNAFLNPALLDESRKRDESAA